MPCCCVRIIVGLQGHGRLQSHIFMPYGGGSHLDFVLVRIPCQMSKSGDLAVDSTFQDLSYRRILQHPPLSGAWDVVA